MNYRYIFGPVPSRRLGISLGIDLIPFKTCTYDCLYCECGKTTVKTSLRGEYVSARRVIAELDAYLSKKPELDYITFAGSGEPALNTKLGRVIAFLKKKYPAYRVAVLTNGSLLYRKSARKSMLGADLVIPSLDAASAGVFRKLNRPAPGLKLKKIIEGLRNFRKEYAGIMKLEIFIVPGINDTPPELKKLKAAAEEISPDAVQLNTAARPGTRRGIKAAGEKEMKKIAAFFRPLKCELPHSFRRKARGKTAADVRSVIMETLKRRPVTLTELAAVLGFRVPGLSKYTGELLKKGEIKLERHGGKTFLAACGREVK